MPTNHRRKLALAATIGLMFLLFGVGSHPASGHIIPPPWDKIVHFLIFGVLVVALRQLLPSMPTLIVCTLGLVIGAADEWHQMYVPNRTPDFDDWLADAIGVIIGIWFWARFSLLSNKQAI